jgi:hypothetical protein
VGLSGILHGYVVAGALLLAARQSRIGLGLLASVAAKVAWEQYAGPIPFTQASAGGPVVVAAHLYGAVGGAAAAAIRLAWRRMSPAGRHAL